MAFRSVTPLKSIHVEMIPTCEFVLLGGFKLAALLKGFQTFLIAAVKVSVLAFVANWETANAHLLDYHLAPTATVGAWDKLTEMWGKDLSINAERAESSC